MLIVVSSLTPTFLIFYGFLCLCLSLCFQQLVCSVNWENWCVKVRLLVFHFRSVVTTPLTVCLFTLMSPAAMVTCFYLPSLLKLFAIKRTPFCTLKLRRVNRGTMILEIYIVPFNHYIIYYIFTLNKKPFKLGSKLSFLLCL